MTDKPEQLMRVSVSTNIGKASNISFELTAPVLADSKFLDGILDKLRSSIERQEAHFYVQEIEMQLQIEEGTFKNLTTDFAAIELREEKERKAFYENRRGNDRRDWKRPEREEQHRAQSLKIIEAQKDKIDKLKAKIEELKKKAA